MNQLVLLLHPFEEFSHEFEHEDAAVGLIIPGVRMFIKHFSKPVASEESSAVRNARRQILLSIETRVCWYGSKGSLQYGNPSRPKI